MSRSNVRIAVRVAASCMAAVSFFSRHHTRSVCAGSRVEKAAAAQKSGAQGFRSRSKSVCLAKRRRALRCLAWRGMEAGASFSRGSRYLLGVFLTVPLLPASKNTSRCSQISLSSVTLPIGCKAVPPSSTGASHPFRQIDAPPACPGARMPDQLWPLQLILAGADRHHARRECFISSVCHERRCHFMSCLHTPPAYSD